MSGTLYAVPNNFRTQKIQIAAKLANFNLTVFDHAPNFVFGETNKSDAFLKKFPLGKVPAFESSTGEHLFETDAIAYFVANQQLRCSNDASAAAQVVQWLSFAANEILPNACTWVYPCLGIIQYNKGSTDKAKDELKHVLSLLNGHLKTKTYLVGERVSLADISVAVDLLMLYQWVLEPSFRQPYQNVNRWFNTLVNQPAFKEVLGEVKLCEKMAQFDSKKFNELHQKAGGGEKKEKQEKAPKQAQPAKKEEKPAPAAADDGGDFDDDDGESKRKEKDPFSALPAGTFVMDEWKKQYSNNDIKTVAMPWFFEHFDAAHYSVWFCEYLYADELRLTFMTANLIRGMCQRLDKMRKHAFGSMCIFGENNKNNIAGVWIWRGQDLAFKLHSDLEVDYESYKWTKLDFSAPETRKLIEDYFLQGADLTFHDKKYCDGQIFK